MFLRNQGSYSLGRRYFLAYLVLVFIVALIPLVTLYNNSADTNFIVMNLQLLFFLILARESFGTMKEFFSDAKNLGVALSLASFFVVVVISSILTDEIFRSLFYISNLLFFVSLVAYFSRVNQGFVSVVGWKVISVITVSLIFFIFWLLDKEVFYGAVFRDPPLYRHLRHLNYDLMAAIFSLFYLLVFGKIRISGFLLSLGFLVVISVWTGGRGQLVTFFIFMGFFWFFGNRKTFWYVLGVTLSAIFLVWISGETRFLAGQLERTIASSDMNSVLTGRLGLWEQAFHQAMEGGWLGQGADHFRIAYEGTLVHPHNSILQFMLEYGFVGLLLCLLFFSSTGIICLGMIVNSGSSQALKTIAAFVLSMYAYSLVDGIFYHAIPFSFMVLVAAGCFVEFQNQEPKSDFLQRLIKPTKIAGENGEG